MDIKDMVFVFGSNTAGIHGGGAAHYAYKHRGARWGASYGHYGETFAIPTKGHIFRLNQTATNSKPMVGDTLCLNSIREYVTGFLAFARHHPELTFQVTCIGCGLAGLKHEDIAPMFRQATKNCHFDDKWKPWLEQYGFQFWGAG